MRWARKRQIFLWVSHNGKPLNKESVFEVISIHSIAQYSASRGSKWQIPARSSIRVIKIKPNTLQPVTLANRKEGKAKGKLGMNFLEHWAIIVATRRHRQYLQESHFMDFTYHFPLNFSTALKNPHS